MSGSLSELFEATEFQAPNFYPERWRSRLLVFRNLWLPFHNWRFAILLGLIYMVFGWMFQLSVADPLDSMRQSRYANADAECLSKLMARAAEHEMSACKADAYKRVDALLAPLRLQLPTDDVPKPDLPKFEGQQLSNDELRQVTDYFKLEMRTLWQELLLSVSPKRVVFGMLANPAFFIMVVALWMGLVHYVDALWTSSFVNWIAKFFLGSLHFLAHMGLLLILTAIFSTTIYAPLVDGKNDLTTVVLGVAAYTLAIVLLGGLLGGIAWGVYWAFTSALFGMHMDAFSALGIANYKSFLRMSFEPGKLTIYPIGLDKVPKKRGWRAPYSGETIPDHNPLIVPKSPLKPHLIEGPITIDAVPKEPRRVA